jgi:hypothetical protein
MIWRLIDMTKVWTAMRGNTGRVIISGMLGNTQEEAAEMVARALRGRPGGRHEEYLKWIEGGQVLVES